MSAYTTGAGDCLRIGLPPSVPAKTLGGEGVQASAESPVPADAPDVFPVGPITDLYIDAFPLMRHVTLRRDPADVPIRREVERELARSLAEAAAPESESLTGWVLLLLGVILIFFALFGGVFVLLHNLFPR